jgi:hypothetical protein
MIEAWNIFIGAGENSHQWIDTHFFHRWADVMDGGGKNMALCWGQAGTYDTELQTNQCPWPLRSTSLSCYWKLWLEALDKGFKGDEGQAWKKFTAQAMASIPEDVHNNINILSMADLMALTDIIPPHWCYHNALLIAFNSQLSFGDTQSVEERSRWAATLLVIAAAQ